LFYQSDFIIIIINMRVLKREIVAKNGTGYLLLEALESEDMYHLYNLISQGDVLTSDTVRNVSILEDFN
jgi:protein pelota